MAVTPICDKCRRRNVVTFQVKTEEAWRTVVLNRWRNVCPSCFDAEAERAGVRYQFVDVGAMSWSNAPELARRYGRKRRVDHWMSPTSNDFLYWLRVDGFYLFEAGVTPRNYPPDGRA